MRKSWYSTDERVRVEEEIAAEEATPSARPEEEEEDHTWDELEGL